MEAGKSTFSEMLKGFGSMGDAADFEISKVQAFQVLLMITVVLLYKLLILPWRGSKKKQMFDELDRLRNMTVSIPRENVSRDGGKDEFLTEEQICYFEKNGYLPPFQLVSKEQAANLRKEAEKAFSEDFQGVSYVGSKVREIEKRHGQWQIESAGLYQALRMKSFRELLRNPKLSRKLASLLGEEVMCWRSQFFDKFPGASGTIWHQNATFRETGKYAKLQPTKDTDPAVIQLTAWIALSESTIENGCLRFLPGSFSDARMDFLYSFIQDNKLFYISLLPFSFRYFFDVFKVVLFGQIFAKSILVFLTAAKLLGEDFFDKFKVKDMEMKPGECIVFSSLNMHASYPNTCSSNSRFSFVGRCTANHVRIAPGGKDIYSTAEGMVEYELPEVGSFQVYGRDTFGYNKILED
ncbi:phytanoyl-CoA dioxygenase family protein [Microbulbifer sp. JMSA004]|uniref:phytanoyl-CoA dioxygenase family protein n=1 Tax=unclassified Microbulbifer TaxID=2619833 RepID=UPI00403AE2AA